jgi:hypothetical protein
VRIAELIRINPAPQVITLGQVEALKRGLHEGKQATAETAGQLRALLEHYFISESDHRQALAALLQSMAGGNGYAALVYGPFGAGKSHLLAVISLLAEFPQCWPIFLSSHHEFARFAPTAEKKHLVVQVALDDYASAAHSLEDIVFGQIERELAQDWHRSLVPLTEPAYFLEVFENKARVGHEAKWAEFLARREGTEEWEELREQKPDTAMRMAQAFLDEIGLPLVCRRSRAEAIAILFGHLQANGFAGMVVLLDELATFLAGKDKQALNRDAAFLQFLGQQTSQLPLWLAATAQRSLEDVGDIDSHTLRQVRDRFRGRFTLSVAEIRRVIAEKLVERIAPATFTAQIAGIYQGYEERAGRVTFSAQELEQSYPVNPLGLECLEALAGNFLSATRSLIGIVQTGVMGDVEVNCNHSGRSKLLPNEHQAGHGDSALQLQSPDGAAAGSGDPALQQTSAGSGDPALQQTSAESGESALQQSSFPATAEKDAMAGHGDPSTLLRTCPALHKQFADITNAESTINTNASLLGKDVSRLLTLDRVFDGEWHELAQLPEAGRYREAWEFLDNNLAGMMESADLAAARAIAKQLVLAAMAGLRWPVKRLADALIGSDETRLWGNWAEVERILRRMWRKGAYIELERASEPGENIFFLEVNTDISNIVRRRLNEARAVLEDDDGRVRRGALGVCNGQELPLGQFISAGAVGIDAGNVRRYINVQCRAIAEVKAEELAQMAADLEAAASREDSWLIVSLPHPDPGQEEAHWQACMQKVSGRFAPALCAWLPRALTESEWEILIELAALNLLLADATLGASRKNREVRGRLQERLAGVREESRRILTRAYLEGEILGKDTPAALPVAELRTEKWEELLAGIFQKPLATVFYDFAGIAPRQKLSGKLHTNQIIERFLRPGQIESAGAGALEEHIANYLAPLGFVRKEEGRLYLAVEQNALVEQVLTLLPEATAEPQPEAVMSYRELEGRLRKGRFGLTPEMVELVVGALVRSGYLRGVDGFMLPLHLAQTATPLADNLVFVMRGALLGESERRWLEEVGRRLFGVTIEANDLAAQEALWDRLRGWSGRARNDVAELGQGLEELRQSLGQEAIRWSASRAVLEQLPRLFEKDISGWAAMPGVSMFLAGAAKSAGSARATLEVLERFARLRRFLRQHAPLLTEANVYLSHESMLLAEDSSLAKQRAVVLAAIAGGEEIIAKADTVVAVWEKIRQSYNKNYCAWHAQQQALAHFRPYLEIKESAQYRLAGRLAPVVGAEAQFDVIAKEIDCVLARHCAGAALPGALNTVPVCPQCGLRLGEKLQLVEAATIRQALEKLCEEVQNALFQPERLALLQTRLAGEEESDLRRRLEQLLQGNSRDLDTELVSPEAAQWLARQLRARVGPRRNARELVELLHHKQLTRTQALRIFLGWLEKDKPVGEDELIDFE